MCLFIGALLLIASLLPGNNLKLSFGHINEMNTDWQLEYGLDSEESINLPKVIEAPINEPIQISKILPKSFESATTLRLRSSMQMVLVYLDKALIYDSSIKKSGNSLYNPVASAWILIDLPSDSDGKLLSIISSSDVSVMSGRLNEVYYGSRSELVGELLSRQPLSVMVAVFIFSTWLLSLFVSFVINSGNTKRFKYLSIFSLSIALWLISEMDIMQLFTGNNYVVGTISYLMLPVATIAFIQYIKEVALTNNKLILNIISVLMTGYLVISMTLQLIFDIHVITSFTVFIIMLLLTVLLIIGLLMYETIKHKSLKARKQLMYVTILVITTVIETVMFLTGAFMNVSSFSNVGIGVFLFMLVTDSIMYINGVISKENESRYLREMAYTDVLTGGNNRAAFERDIDKLLAKDKQKSFRLVMLDLNNLKQINDDYGHEAGDVALRDFHDGLVKIFGKDSKCYRIGGDEFMVTTMDTKYLIFKQAVTVLEAYMEEIGIERGYRFRTAYGSDVYDYTMSFGAFKHEVDRKMYDNKFRMKSSQ